MTFSAVSTIGSSTANSFTLAPHAVGDFILVGVLAGFTVGSTTSYATSLTSTNVTWSVLVAHTAFSASTGEQTIFIGRVTSASSATVTVGFNTGTPVCRTAWQEFSNTLGYTAVTLDTSGTVDVASAGHFPGIASGHGAGDLYWGYLWDAGTGSAGSTSGFTYQFDANGNPAAYNASCGTGTITPNIGDTTDGVSGIAVLLYEAVTAVSGAGALSGTGALGAAGQLAAAGAAGLAGSGSLAAAASGSAVISGAGALGATGVRTAHGAAALAGSGVLASTGTSSGVFLTGTGVLGVTGVRVAAGAAGLAGAGALSAYEQAGALSGTGSLTAAATVFAPPGAGALTGTGALGVTGLILGYAAGLSGQGALTAFQSQQLAFLSGLGALGVTGERLGYALGLTGIGYLSVPQVTGGLVNGAGGAAVPQALPGSSQVAVAAPGSAAWQWLGTLGQVTALTYSFICPGGCDQMTCTVMVPAAYRTQLFDPGWQVKVVRGGHDVWHGKLDEPVSTASGWNLTAVGTGNLGQNFRAYYAPGDTWPTGVADDIMNRAIARGLPWVSPGMAASPYYSQFWFGQQTDPGSQTVTAFLNLICTRGALTWYVNSQPGGSYLGDDLQVFPLPSVPDRLLVCATPVARTLGGDTNTIFIRYESVADNAATGVAASYNVVTAVNAQSVAAHGTLETYIDLSDAGQMSSSAAQAVGSAALQFYQRASFAGPFQASYGQLLNNGGAPVDPGTDQAGTVVRLLLTDFGYGGEVVPGPITFIAGAYSWDDFAQVATVTPYQSFDQSLTGMLSTDNTVLTPITAAST